MNPARNGWYTEGEKGIRSTAFNRQIRISKTTSTIMNRNKTSG